MSGYTCRETYCSYGSYLRSRGYDKAICNLFTDIEAGNVKVGPIVPEGECNVTINGDVAIQECDDSTQGAGILSLYGGSKGNSGTPSAYSDFGLQAYTGAHFVGPVVQTSGGYVNETDNNSAGEWNVLTNDTTFASNVTIQETLDVSGIITANSGVTGDLSGNAVSATGMNEENIYTTYSSTSTAPTSGTHAIGELALEYTSDDGNHYLWVCVSSGTPGTWKSAKLA